MIKQQIVMGIKLGISKLPQKFQMAPHNLVGHPCMEILGWFGLEKQANWVHDVTLPLDSLYEDLSVD